jgi:hypothetical protein
MEAYNQLRSVISTCHSSIKRIGKLEQKSTGADLNSFNGNQNYNFCPILGPTLYRILKIILKLNIIQMQFSSQIPYFLANHRLIHIFFS